MLRIGFAIVLLFAAVTFFAQAQIREEDAKTPEQVVQHHWDAFSHHDLESVLSDYADDAVFIAPNQTVQGKAALRQMFSTFFSGSANAQTSMSFDVKVTADGDVGYEHWLLNAGKPGALEGTDAFVVRHGKILFHTVVGVHPASGQK